MGLHVPGAVDLWVLILEVHAHCRIVIINISLFYKKNSYDKYKVILLENLDSFIKYCFLQKFEMSKAAVKVFTWPCLQ